MSKAGAMRNFVFCLDSSEAAFCSEDLGGGTRWSFQLQAADLLVKSSSSDGKPPRTAVARSDASLEHVYIAMGGRPRVIPISAEATTLASVKRELSERVLPAGASDLAKSLRLALLTGRMRKCTHVVIFVASEPEAGAGDLQGLAHSLQGCGLGLDIVVLTPESELSERTVSSLTSFANAQAEGAMDVRNCRSEGNSPCPSARLTFLHPDDQPGLDDSPDPWQLLEVLQEELTFTTPPRLSPSRGGRAAPSAAVPPSSTTRVPMLAGCGVGPAGAPPPHHHRAPLLRGRSGINGPAICRYESLDSLGHLSIDGFMRPWLPSYSNVPKAGPFVCVRQGANELWYLYVYSLPKWRTLVEVSAGRMLLLNNSDRAGALGASPSPGSGGAAAQAGAPSPFLQAPASGSGSIGGGGAAAAPSDATGPRHMGHTASSGGARHRSQVLVPDLRRGVLRLLQSSAHAGHFKLTWQQTPGGGGSSVGPNLFEQAERARRQVSDDCEWEVKVSSNGSTQARFLRVARRANDHMDCEGSGEEEKKVESQHCEGEDKEVAAQREVAAAAQLREQGQGQGEEHKEVAEQQTAEEQDTSSSSTLQDELEEERLRQEAASIRGSSTGGGVLCVEVSSTRARVRSGGSSSTSGLGGGGGGDAGEALAEGASLARHLFWLQQAWSGERGERGASALAAHLARLVRSPPPIPPEPDLEAAIRDEAVQPVKIGPFPSALVRAILDSRLKAGGPRAAGGGGGGGGHHHGGSKRGHSGGGEGAGNGGAGGGGGPANAGGQQARAAGGCTKSSGQAAGTKQMKKLVKPCGSSPELLAARAISGGGSMAGAGCSSSASARLAAAAAAAAAGLSPPYQPAPPLTLPLAASTSPSLLSRLKGGNGGGCAAAANGLTRGPFGAGSAPAPSAYAPAGGAAGAGHVMPSPSGGGGEEEEEEAGMSSSCSSGSSDDAGEGGGKCAALSDDATSARRHHSGEEEVVSADQAAALLHCVAPAAAAAITGQAAAEGANAVAGGEAKQRGEAGHDDSLLFDLD